MNLTQWMQANQDFLAAEFVKGGSPAVLTHIEAAGYPKPDRHRVRHFFNRRGFRSGLVTRPGTEAWDDIAHAKLAELYSDARLPQSYIVEQIGHPWSSIKHQAHVRGLKRGFPESPVPVYTVPNIDLRGPGILVLADVHVPYQDSAWLDRVTDLARNWGIRKVLFAGDGLDAQALSRFETFDFPNTLTEMSAWKELEEAVLDRFREVYWSLGNHELRIGKSTEFKFRTADMLRGLYVNDQERVHVLDSFAVTINREWRIEHPKASGDKAAIDIANHHLMHTAIAHTHHSSEALTPSGRHHAVRIGAGCDHSRMLYCSRITHGKYAMTQGAFILRTGTDGELHHYNLTPDMDLAAMVRMYRREEWKTKRSNGR